MAGLVNVRLTLLKVNTLHGREEIYSRSPRAQGMMEVGMSGYTLIDNLVTTIRGGLEYSSPIEPISPEHPMVRAGGSALPL